MGKNSSQLRVETEYLVEESIDLRLVSRKERYRSVSVSSSEPQHSPDPPGEDQKTADEKAARMLEKFANEHFNSVRDVQRMRLQLLSWVIRNKITSSLKRAFDIVVSISLLLLSSPIFVLIAILIKLDSPGSIFFSQVRVGKWGKPFNIYKFRSMSADAEQRKSDLLGHNEADGVVFKIKSDPRVTRFGRFLRKSSLDELPQFYNVLKGDMSLVGPRPPVPYEVEQYHFDERRRLNAIPGITGLQQISGRSDMPFKQWVEYDIQYIEESSLLKDIEILARTIPAVLRGKGAY
jgi:exopolysaccharide biosynthesis polyprenyl glycosylphosphotransferase